MRSDANVNHILILAIFLVFDHSSIIFRSNQPSSSPTHSVSAFKKCKQKIVAIETKKVIPVPYPVPMLMKPAKKPRPQTIVVTVPKPVYKKKKSCGSCGKKHVMVPNVGIKCPYQQQNQQQPMLPNLAGLLPTGVTNSINDVGTTTSTITQTARQIETVMDYGLNYNYPNYNYNYNYRDSNNDYENEPLSDYDYGSLNDYNGDYGSSDQQPQRRKR